MQPSSPGDGSRPAGADPLHRDPAWLSFVVAVLAGVAGMLAMTSRKSGALVGVLISVTTIPAAGNVGVDIAYGDV